MFKKAVAGPRLVKKDVAPKPKIARAWRGAGSAKTRAKRKDTAAVVRAVHAEVWKVRKACQLCRGNRKRECLTPDQMHEFPSRAATRGRPPEERFNVRVCGRICHACHTDITENRICVVFADPAQGFAGPVSSAPVIPKGLRNAE
jgi:hypothetical protein